MCRYSVTVLFETLSNKAQFELPDATKQLHFLRCYRFQSPETNHPEALEESQRGLEELNVSKTLTDSNPIVSETLKIADCATTPSQSMTPSFLQILPFRQFAV
jgi:hypothetical protein